MTKSPSTIEHCVVLLEHVLQCLDSIYEREGDEAGVMIPAAYVQTAVDLLRPARQLDS